MAICVHDTLSRTVKPLAPREPGTPYRMYCCGPTVYGPAHIGNFRTFILQDVLRRALQMDGVEVLHVRNITDVDDKTIRRSQEEGVSLGEFTQKWTRKFHADCAALNLLPPHIEPSAVEHIPLQVDMIKNLMERGHAYRTPDGSVYFKVRSFPEYGKLSHLEPESLRTQDTNSAGDLHTADEYGREHAHDFALWKARKPEDGRNFWPSPWGEGRPGWHIECSAMSTHYLGGTFDLHGGGVDLCFPHHENEIAQAECSTGERGLAAHWFHCAHLMVDGVKMSKSLGNLYTLDDLRAKGASPAALRYALVAGHYRSQLNFTLKGLSDATSAIAKIQKAARKLLARAGLEPADFAPPEVLETVTTWGIFQKAWDCLRNDLNIPSMLGQLFAALPRATMPGRTLEEVRADLSGLGNLLYVLGIKLFEESAKNAKDPDAADGVNGGANPVIVAGNDGVAAAAQTDVPEAIRELAERRKKAKEARDYATADALRAQLEGLGWKLTDSKAGHILTPL
ncbi:MAG: cysteine--tRNA ligase [Puniceicoccales bacterium]|jgi:cysteinyl-tRNA synthetase|nr:cysteine--tRNA ligase [Puniceicoccales bacterium]